MRYNLQVYHPQKGTFRLDTPDYATDAERDADFAAMQAPAADGGMGLRLFHWKAITEQAQTTPAAATGPTTTPAAPAPPPPTTPTSAPPSAIAGTNQQPPAGPGLLSSIQPPGTTEEQFRKGRTSMLGEAAKAAVVAGSVVNPLVGAGEASLAASASPLVRTLGPAALRAGAASVGGLGAAGAESMIRGENWDTAKTRMIDETFKSGLAQLGGDILLGGAGRMIGSIFRNTIGVGMTATQQAALHQAWAEADRANRPFSVVGWVMQAPEFAGSPARTRIERIAGYGGRTLQEREGVPQIRYAAEQAERSLTGAGGRLSPQAQGVTPGFGSDVRPLITQAQNRYQNESRQAAAATIPRMRAPQQNRRQAARNIIADPNLTPEQAATQMAGVQRIPNENALARQAAQRDYQNRLDAATQTHLDARYQQIRDRTGIDLRTVTQEDLATQLRGATPDRVTALIQDIPELAPTIGRAKLTDAIEASGNVATDSFNPAIFAAQVRSIGDHNFDRAFGSNAGPMRELLHTFDTFAEGTATAARRADEIAGRVPRWQMIAAGLAPVLRMASGASALGVGSALGGGGGLLFGATTGAMATYPYLFTSILSNPRTLRRFTSLVRDAGNQTLTPQTMRGYARDFARALAPQLGIRAGEISESMGPSETPADVANMTESFNPTAIEEPQKRGPKPLLRRSASVY